MSSEKQKNELQVANDNDRPQNDNKTSDQSAASEIVPPSQSSSARKPATMFETFSDVGVTYGTRVARDALGLQASGDRARAAFHEIARGFETYMSEGQPLQMLQDLQICGPDNVPRLGQDPYHLPSQQHPLAPPELRHIRSSPLQSLNPFVLADYSGTGTNNDGSGGPSSQVSPEEDALPPPIPLDPFLRSSSTPSSFRQRSIGSAFETTSSFRHPRANFVSDTSARYSSAFDPVKYYARQLEDMERTSIEVMDVPRVEEMEETPSNAGRRGAASRAAQFLADVRVLRRRRKRHPRKDDDDDDDDKPRGGRENPARPTTVSIQTEDHTLDVEEKTHYDASDSESAIAGNNTGVTVVAEAPSPTPNETSFLSRNSELSAIEQSKQSDTSLQEDDSQNSPPVLVSSISGAETNSKNAVDHNNTKEPEHYQQFDSDHEEEVQYQRIEAQLQTESPGTVPSPSYQRLVDEQVTVPIASSDDATQVVENICSNTSSLRVRVCSTEKRLETTVATPSPTQMMVSSDANSYASDSATESPVTARSGSTSGHTTQATSASSSMGQSCLSTISETDREVMEANKEAKRRRSLSSLVRKPADHDGTSIHSSSTTSSSSRGGYIALEQSSVSLRDGANVPADRFFKDRPEHPVVRSSTTTSSSTRRSGQTNSPSTHTSSSSSQEEPPTFVSYLDNETRLLSVREGTETSSQRGKDEPVREDSPAPELADYSLDEMNSPHDSGSAKSTHNRFRRPPRSPYLNGKRSSSTPTPPPRSPVVFHHQLSPPRNLVGPNDADPMVMSRSSVMRATPVATPDGGYEEEEVVVADNSKFLMSTIANGLLRGVGGVKGQAYEDGNVEILKTDSQEDRLTPEVATVTPEKRA